MAGPTSGRRALHEAASRNNPDCVRLLTKWGADVNLRGGSGGGGGGGGVGGGGSGVSTPLGEAVKAGSDAAAAELLSLGASAEYNGAGATLLREFAASGDAGAVRALVRFGASVNAASEKRKKTALMAAAAADAPECVRVLLDSGAEVDCRQCGGRTALQEAVAAEAEGCIPLLLEAGADLEAVDYSSHLSPLQEAARAGWSKGVRRLLEAGADADAMSFSNGSTALHLAAAAGADECVLALLDAGGADPNVVDPSTGCAPLHLAAGVGASEGCARLLLEFGASVDAANPFNGTTALHESASSGTTDVARTLLQWGASTQVADAAGLIPEEIASIKSPNGETAKLLLEAAARQEDYLLHEARWASGGDGYYGGFQAMFMPSLLYYSTTSESVTRME